MKNLIVLQARTSSTRLPKKVLKEINGKPMIFWQIMRIWESKNVTNLVVATSTDKSDDELADFLLSIGVEVYRGALENVLSRFENISEKYNPESIVRLTADCPLLMPEVVDLVVETFFNSNFDYVSNTLERTYADGLDVEIFSSDCLHRLRDFRVSSLEEEHVTLGMYSRPKVFSLSNVANDRDEGNLRWTVDYQSDLDFVCRVYENFQSREIQFNLQDVRNFLTYQQAQNIAAPIENFETERLTHD